MRKKQFLIIFIRMLKVPCVAAFIISRFRLLQIHLRIGRQTELIRVGTLSARLNEFIAGILIFIVVDGGQFLKPARLFRCNRLILRLASPVGLRSTTSDSTRANTIILLLHIHLVRVGLAIVLIFVPFGKLGYDILIGLVLHPSLEVPHNVLVVQAAQIFNLTKSPLIFFIVAREADHLDGVDVAVELVTRPVDNAEAASAYCLQLVKVVCDCADLRRSAVEVGKNFGQL